MAINTDGLPSSVDGTKTCVVKGSTLDALCKKAKQKLVFDKTQFDVTEDDSKVTVALKNGCCCSGSAGGGSS